MPVVVIGMFVDKSNLARIFVRGQARFHETLDLGSEQIRSRKAFLQDDKGFDDFGAQCIGLADGGRERHRRMTDQAILDFAGPDPESPPEVMTSSSRPTKLT